MLLVWTLVVCFVFSRPISASVRIVGGSLTTIEDYPYQLSLQYKGQHFCGASILSPKFSLTAAHCFAYFRDSISARAGSTYRDRGGILIDVERVIQHPKYPTYPTYDYDMAVLVLAESLVYSDKIGPVPLPDSSVTEPPAGALGVATGWGYIDSEIKKTSNQLRTVELPIWSWSDCRAKYHWGDGEVTERMFCAGFPEGKKDACVGDSGGPFTVNRTIFGIISYGPGCALAGWPGVYTSIPALRSFIKEHTDL